jgi:hypothetical protein
MERVVSMDISTAVKTYQCPGCIGGPNFSCYEKNPIGSGCLKHCPGTLMEDMGLIFLGMEKGFNRVGPNKKREWRFYILETSEQFKEDISPKFLSTSFKINGLYDNFNIPVWKYLDKNGNTLVRGLSPRINTPFLHIFLWDARKDIHCLELTQTDIESMD